MKKAKRKALTLERLYPTKRARDIADAAVDKLDIYAPLAEHVRTWEWTYLDAGGVVPKGINV